MADIKKVIAWLADTELYYQQEGSECHDSDHQCRMAHAAISVIESLQSENKILSENCDGLSKQRDDFAQTIHEQKMEIERLRQLNRW